MFYPIRNIEKEKLKNGMFYGAGKCKMWWANDDGWYHLWQVSGAFCDQSIPVRARLDPGQVNILR